VWCPINTKLSFEPQEKSSKIELVTNGYMFGACAVSKCAWMRINSTTNYTIIMLY